MRSAEIRKSLSSNRKSIDVIGRKKEVPPFSKKFNQNLQSSFERSNMGIDLHPLLQGPQVFNNKITPIRTASKTYLTEFTQRVMSGKLLQLKQIQSQMTESQNQLQILVEENRSLNRIIKRQEVSLRRYEGENAGMPRLIKAHAEEVRILKTNQRQLKLKLRDTQLQLRERETEILTSKDNILKLRTLAEDKRAFDQEKSDKKIQELESLLQERDREIQLLSRTFLLEKKSYRRQIYNEETSHKKTKKTLEEALETIKKLENEKRSLLLAHRRVQTPLSHLQDTIMPSKELEVNYKKTCDIKRMDNLEKSLPELSFHPHKRQATPTI